LKILDAVYSTAKPSKKYFSMRGNLHNFRRSLLQAGAVSSAKDQLPVDYDFIFGLQPCCSQTVAGLPWSNSDRRLAET
jgi:hypothetical protein